MPSLAVVQIQFAGKPAPGLGCIELAQGLKINCRVNLSRALACKLFIKGQTLIPSWDIGLTPISFALNRGQASILK